MKSQALLVLEIALRRWMGERVVFEARRRCALALQAAFERKQGHNAQEPPRGVPTLALRELTRDRFAEASQGFRQPTVIRGMLTGTRARAKWSAEYFAEHFGSSRYPVMQDASGLLSSRQRLPEATEPGLRRSSEVARDHDERGFEFGMLSVTELLDAVARGDTRYLNNVTSIFADHPRLIEDLELDRLARVLPRGASADDFDALNLFIGGKGTGTGLHCAFAGNFFCNVVGRKRWKFIEPRYTEYLLPLPATPFVYSEAYFDPADPHRNAFTRRLPTFEVVLQPGDVLFNGPWWWHRVENLDAFTVGVAVRRMNMRADLANNLLLTLLSMEPAMHLLRARFRLRRRLLGSKARFRDVLLRELDHAIQGAPTQEDRRDRPEIRSGP